MKILMPFCKIVSRADFLVYNEHMCVFESKSSQYTLNRVRFKYDLQTHSISPIASAGDSSFRFASHPFIY